MSQINEFLTTSFRLDPSVTLEVDRAAAYVQPGLDPSISHSGNTLVGTGSTVQTSTATHTQDTNAYEEPMVNYAYSQHGSSLVPDMPFHPSYPSVTNVPTQWHTPPNVFEHHGQPAPGPSSTANSYTHNNYPQAYAGATGPPQEQQYHGFAWVTMPGGFKFAIPVALAIALMTSIQHH